VFKSQFDTLQQPNGGPNGPFGHEDWDPKLKSAVQLQKDPSGKVSGHSVEIAIPWTAYSKAAKGRATSTPLRARYVGRGGGSWKCAERCPAASPGARLCGGVRPCGG
jgi:hypothetical protein